jgi:hypothetical protein
LPNLPITRLKGEDLNRATNLMIGLRRNGNFCCSKERGGET